MSLGLSYPGSAQRYAVTEQGLLALDRNNTVVLAVDYDTLMALERRNDERYDALGSETSALRRSEAHYSRTVSAIMDLIHRAEAETEGCSCMSVQWESDSKFLRQIAGLLRQPREEELTPVETEDSRQRELQRTPQQMEEIRRHGED